jgi:hypothetical protein
MIDNEYGLQVDDCLICYVKVFPQRREKVFHDGEKNTYIDLIYTYIHLAKINQSKSYEWCIKIYFNSAKS